MTTEVYTYPSGRKVVREKLPTTPEAVEEVEREFTLHPDNYGEYRSLESLDTVLERGKKAIKKLERASDR